MATLLGSIVVFLLVIALHELGHFAMAKFNNILVNEFSIGMGPKIFSKKYKETTYSIRALPVGGYVAMEGEEENSEHERSFNNASVLQRISVVIAGAMMNFLLAIVAFTIVFTFAGVRTNTIDEIIRNSPAEQSGLQIGDKIISVNGIETHDFYDVANQISISKNPLEIKIYREGKEIKKVIKTTTDSQGRKIIGIKPTLKKGLIIGLKNGFLQTKEVVKSIFLFLSTIFTGNFKSDMLSGPVGVISIIGQETKKGILNLINILAIISANLGVINLLPIPALDGGKLLFLCIEGIRGKEIDREFEQKISLMGFVLLFSLMLYITIFNDLKIFR